MDIYIHGISTAVSFPQGFSCTWEVHQPMSKHYAYFDADGSKTQSNAIACDSCAADCWTESYFLPDTEEDLCLGCYKKAKHTHGEFQREGVSVVEAPKQLKKKPNKRKTSKVFTKTKKKRKT